MSVVTSPPLGARGQFFDDASSGASGESFDSLPDPLDSKGQGPFILPGAVPSPRDDAGAGVGGSAFTVVCKQDKLALTASPPTSARELDQIFSPDLRQRVLTLENELFVLRRDNKELQAFCQSDESNLRSLALAQSNEIRELSKQVDQLKIKLDRAHSKIDKKNRNLERAYRTIDDLGVNIAELTDKITQLEHRIAQLGQYRKICRPFRLCGRRCCVIQ